MKYLSINISNSKLKSQKITIRIKIIEKIQKNIFESEVIQKKNIPFRPNFCLLVIIRSQILLSGTEFDVLTSADLSYLELR